MRFNFFIVFLVINVRAQNININNEFNYDLIRRSSLSGNNNSNYSLNILPVDFNEFEYLLNNQNKLIFKNKKNTIELKSLGVDYFLEYNSRHPYNRNNATMIPNRGYQHIISPGFFFRIGPLSIQFKPEHHFSENKNFEGFW